MPAALTRISTSPGPGWGTGRVVGLRTSGPPGAVISMAVMLCGRPEAMGFLLYASNNCGIDWQMYPQARVVTSSQRDRTACFHIVGAVNGLWTREDGP